MESFVGLISGTSADGVDVALVVFEPELRVLAFATRAYPEALASRLRQLGQDGRIANLDELGTLDHAVGDHFAQTAEWALQQSIALGVEVIAVGSHGQTIRHKPSADRPFSMQIGDPSLIAERIGRTTVTDFRRRDMAAGGQGAPLLPALHSALFAHESESRAVLNLGGIANLTLLIPGRPITGFDTGPANGLLDAWCLRHTGRAFDQDGAWAASGRPDPELVASWLGDPWFALPPPKSTGRDQFHLDWLESRSSDLSTRAAEDVQASLLALSVRSISDALARESSSMGRLLVCGGGAQNMQFMRALKAAIPDTRVESTAAHGLDPDAVEAVGFAWLARETLAGRAGNLPSVTGARGSRVLGCVYHA